MKTFTIEVTQTVEVTLDEAKFDAEFMEEFNQTFYNFGNNLDRHAKHLGQMFARGVEDEFSDFIEGYGPVKEMGIKFNSVDCDADVVNCGPLETGK